MRINTMNHSKVAIKKDNTRRILNRQVPNQKALDLCLLNHSEEEFVLSILYYQYGLVLIKDPQGYDVFHSLRK